jgi:hypothetical protein
VALTLDESARLAGGHCWLEQRLFELLGGWVEPTPEPAAKLLFDRHSGHHAWRAGQWWDRLPVLDDVDRLSLVTADPASGQEVLQALAAAPATVGRLAGAYRFALPRLWTRYARHLSLTTPVSDSSSIRTLRMAMADVEADWRDGEALLQQVLREPGLVRAAAETVAGLEAIWVSGGEERRG